MKKQKSPEIIRLQQLLNDLNLTPAEIAEATGISSRTIKNYLWNDLPMGGQMLRMLLECYNVSIDWLLTGTGHMYMDTIDITTEPETTPLIRYIDHTDTNNFQDYWWLVSRAAEQSLIQSGAIPGTDYQITDLYQLTQPFVLEQLKNNNLTLTAYAENPK